MRTRVCLFVHEFVIEVSACYWCANSNQYIQFKLQFTHLLYNLKPNSVFYYAYNMI